MIKIKTPLIAVMELLLVVPLSAQDFGKLIDKVNEIDKRLTLLITAETAQRKAADNAILKKAGTAGNTADDGTITSTIDALDDRVDRNAGSIDSLSSSIADLSQQVDSLSAATVSDDRVAEMAVMLKGLTDELKAVLSKSKSAPVKSAPEHTGITATEETESGPDEEKEAMEIGGLVTVDAASDPTNLRGGSAEIGEVDLSANVNVADGVVASITVLAEGNMSELSIDQALVSVAPENRPFSFLFGQQTFSFGLLSTRLISDPTIIDDVETIGPGIVANYSYGAFTPGVAATFFHEDATTVKVFRLNPADTTVISEDSVESPESNLFAGIVNCDLALPNESAARFAARFYGDVIDLTIGGGVALGPLTLDIELYGEVLDDDDAKKGGYYAGLAWGINDNLEAAFRYDGYTEASFEAIAHRIGIGGTISFKHGIFCALEYALSDIGSDEPEQEIALQVGLESTIKLPGFQRKTLTRK